MRFFVSPPGLIPPSLLFTFSFLLLFFLSPDLLCSSLFSISGLTLSHLSLRHFRPRFCTMPPKSKIVVPDAIADAAAAASSLGLSQNQIQKINEFPCDNEKATEFLIAVIGLYSKSPGPRSIKLIPFLEAAELPPTTLDNISQRSALTIAATLLFHETEENQLDQRMIWWNQVWATGQNLPFAPEETSGLQQTSASASSASCASSSSSSSTVAAAVKGHFFSPPPPSSTVLGNMTSPFTSVPSYMPRSYSADRFAQLQGSYGPRMTTPFCAPMMPRMTMPPTGFSSTPPGPFWPGHQVPVLSSFSIRSDSWRRRGILGQSLMIPNGPNVVLDYLVAEINKEISSEVVKLGILSQIDMVLSFLNDIQPALAADPNSLPWIIIVLDNLFLPVQRCAESLLFYLNRANKYAPSFITEYYKMLDGHPGDFTPADLKSQRKAVKTWCPMKSHPSSSTSNSFFSRGRGESGRGRSPRKSKSPTRSRSSSPSVSPHSPRDKK